MQTKEQKKEYASAFYQQTKGNPIPMLNYKKARKEQIEKNCDNRIKRQKQYRLDNKEQLQKYHKEWHIRNKEKNNSRAAEYYKKNKKIELKRNKKYIQENKEKINEKAKQYCRKRYYSDTNYRILRTIRSRLYLALKAQEGSKTRTTKHVVGCSVLELKQHLEKQFAENMSWDNYGQWHIDHIIPCASFDLTDENEQKKCFHYTNLQPLWAKENQTKGAK